MLLLYSHPGLSRRDARHQTHSRGIDLPELLFGIHHHHAGWQRIEKFSKTVGENLFLSQLTHAFATGCRQLLVQAGHPALQLVIGLNKLFRNLVEHQEGIFQLFLLFRTGGIRLHVYLPMTLLKLSLLAAIYMPDVAISFKTVSYKLN